MSAGVKHARRIAYVIPAFNERAVIAGVVQDLKRNAPPGDVVIVDDASNDDTAAVATVAGAIVLRHLMNRGQGAALQTGFEAALRLGADIIVTFDADGQHCAGDVDKLIKKLTRENVDVVLGSRFLSLESKIPVGRKLLLKLGVLFTRLVSHMSVTDTHNGLRVFRAAALQKIRLTEDRMAHASELLDAIALAGLSYVEHPCHIRYTDYSTNKGQSWSAAPRIVFDFLLGKLMR